MTWKSIPLWTIRKSITKYCARNSNRINFCRMLSWLVLILYWKIIDITPTKLCVRQLNHYTSTILILSSKYHLSQWILLYQRFYILSAGITLILVTTHVYLKKVTAFYSLCYLCVVKCWDPDVGPHNWNLMIKYLHLFVTSCSRVTRLEHKLSSLWYVPVLEISFSG